MKTSNSVIIVAGGSGKRMASEIPKQFLLLDNKPILFYSLEAFHAFNPSIHIVLVLPESNIKLWKSLCKEYDFYIKHEIVKGGKTRFGSVKNGLEKIQDGWVAIHDGARPIISKENISALFMDAQTYGNAVPTTPINESVRIFADDENEIMDRSILCIIQTPQIFKSADLKRAYKQIFEDRFTDDASVVETLGVKIHLSKGDSKNIKITQAADLKIAAALLSNH